MRIGIGLGDLSILLFAKNAGCGVRRGEFDGIYVSGITVVRAVAPVEMLGRLGIWCKANEDEVQEVPKI